jgi:IstB-like ATP binding protein
MIPSAVRACSLRVGSRASWLMTNCRSSWIAAKSVRLIGLDAILESILPAGTRYARNRLSDRDERRITMASKIAHFPALHGEALLLLGPPGVGKTHLAIALGRAAIREGYSVLFTTAPALVAALAKAYVEGRLEERLGFFAKPKLLYAPIIWRTRIRAVCRQC